MVNVRFPVCDWYTASIAVNGPPALAVIDPTPALTNLCSYASSVTPIATLP